MQIILRQEVSILLSACVFVLLMCVHLTSPPCNNYNLEHTSQSEKRDLNARILKILKRVRKILPKRQALVAC